MVNISGCNPEKLAKAANALGADYIACDVTNADAVILHRMWHFTP